MSSSEEAQAKEQLYPSPCGYFPDRTAYCEAYALFSRQDAYEFYRVNSAKDKNPSRTAEHCQLNLFEELLLQGFRRSGDVIYKEVCPDCKKCVPIRITVADFSLSKSQRHLLRKNSAVQLTVTANPADFLTEEKVMLMQKYDKRHAPDKTETPSEVRDMLKHMNGIASKTSGDGNPVYEKQYAGTLNMEYRLDDRLIGCGIVDITQRSLSSNYFYYDISPEVMKMGIGTFSILKEIDFCKEQNLLAYYLGYWISDCKKMSYKANFKPHELLTDNGWTTIDDEST